MHTHRIDKLLGDAELSQRYGEAGRKRVVENFTIPQMVALMNECYSACMNGKQLK